MPHLVQFQVRGFRHVVARHSVRVLLRLSYGLLSGFSLCELQALSWLKSPVSRVLGLVCLLTDLYCSFLCAFHDPQLPLLILEYVFVDLGELGAKVVEIV